MKKIIIEDFVGSKKLAVLNNGNLEKIHIQSSQNKSFVNNIYRGRVNKIIKNINACFVDVGGCIGYLNLRETNVKEGDNLLVQVIKDPIGDKKMKLSLEIAIRGKYMVYIGSNDRISFSKKITSSEEVTRLKSILKNNSINCGLIIRTEAYGISEKELIREYSYLKDRYDNIQEIYSASFSPKLLYCPKDYMLTYIEDNIEEIDEIHICCNEFSKVMRDEIKSNIPQHLIKIKEYGVEDLFENFGINAYISKLNSRVIRLKNGGSVVFDRTEAMTVIDVNTSGVRDFVGNEETKYFTNIEAAKEICNQIISRDIGGIIIIDFINMDKKRTQDLKKYVINCFRKDLSRTRVYEFTKLGLLEISRMRKSYSVDYYFKGDDYILDRIEAKVINYISHKGLREIDINKIVNIHGKSVKITKDKYVIIKNRINEIEDKYNCKIVHKDI